jgi:hypothetical protein
MTNYPFPSGVLMFRVEPETRSHYFHVYIWPTLATMRHYVRTYGKGHALRSGAAFTLDFTADRTDAPRGLLGQMHFAKRHLIDDFISHEALHSVLIYARWRRIDGGEVFSGIDPKSASEERLCYALGAMCGQIKATAEKYGFL